MTNLCGFQEVQWAGGPGGRNLWQNLPMHDLEIEKLSGKVRMRTRPLGKSANGSIFEIEKLTLRAIMRTRPVTYPEESSAFSEAISYNTNF